VCYTGSGDFPPKADPPWADFFVHKIILHQTILRVYHNLFNHPVGVYKNIAYDSDEAVMFA